MKVKIKVEQEVDIKYLHVSAGVRYWDDATVNGTKDAEGALIPCRNGDRWEPVIDLDESRIINWKQSVKADIHYKVCDDGIYELKDVNQKSIAKKEGYVPEIMCPEENGFGDYIIMKVDENGIIANFDPDPSELAVSDDED